MVILDHHCLQKLYCTCEQAVVCCDGEQCNTSHYDGSLLRTTFSSNSLFNAALSIVLSKAGFLGEFCTHAETPTLHKRLRNIWESPNGSKPLRPMVPSVQAAKFTKPAAGCGADRILRGMKDHLVVREAASNLGLPNPTQQCDNGLQTPIEVI